MISLHPLTAIAVALVMLALVNGWTVLRLLVHRSECRFNWSAAPKRGHAPRYLPLPGSSRRAYRRALTDTVLGALFLAASLTVPAAAIALLAIYATLSLVAYVGAQLAQRELELLLEEFIFAREPQAELAQA